MRIGLATENLALPATGVEVALREMIEGLRDDGQDVVCFHSRDPRHPGIPGVEHHLFRAPLPIPFYHRLAAVFHRRCFERVDVLHLPYPQMPFAFKPRVPVVVTVHDLSPLVMPEVHTWKRVLFFRHVLPRILAVADRVLASSEATRDDLLRRLRIPERKVRVVPLAAGPRRDVADGDPGVGRPYVLYVGTLEPRKNLPRLLQAFARLKARGAPHALVLAGRKGWGWEPVFRTIDALDLRSDVLYKGYVTEEERTRLYRGAAAAVYPSLYEGFGLPVLEAMAEGTPVVASNASSIPEVAGDAAFLADPRDVDGLATALAAATDPGRREVLAAKGRARAALFSRGAMIARLRSVYEEVRRS